ncbi:unnamed protein product [Blepharisma stoltei]|uniref:Uncharacterized protein n=1 Tax=Blepharisma stoltei TaxID=1481888 RepID=A0AAU9K1A1_9CILI|nr:unnamed protein product [Blepharisma stoltei]
MFSRFQKSFKSINIKKLNIVACGSIAIMFLADRFYHKTYFPTLLSKLPNIPNPERINFKTLDKDEETINDLEIHYY